MIGDGSAAAMAADHLAESLHAVSPDATVALAAGPTPALVALVSLAVLVSSLALFVLRHRAASLSKAPVAAGPGGGSKYQPLATKDVAAVAATNGEERKGEGDKAERDDSKVAIGILFGTQTGTSEGFAKPPHSPGRLTISPSFLTRNPCPSSPLQTLVSELQHHFASHCTVELSSLDDLAEDSDGFTAKLKAFHATFFLVATYGDGEPTDDAQRFFKWLHATAAHAEAQDDSPVPLQGLRFAVFGLGNRQYEHFNLMGKMLDKHLAALGGQRVAEVGLGDDDQCIEDDFKAWRAGLWKGFEALVLGRGAGGEGQQGEGAAGEWEDEEEEVQEYQVRFHSRVGQAGVAGENGELNGGLNGHVHEEMNGKMNGETNGKVNGGEKQVNGVGEHKNGGEEEEEQMSMGEAIAAVGWHSHSIGRYEVGDHVAVFPENSDADVAAVAKCLGLDLDDVISLHLPSPSLLLLAASCAKQCHPPIPLCTPVAARPFPCPNATSFFPTALAALHQAALAVLAHFASHPDEAARLKHLASDGGKAEYREWVAAAHRSLLEVLQAFPSARPPLAVFLASVAPRLQPRFYSISSHPRHEPGALHITCAVVRDITPAGRIHHGVCSSFLHRHLPLPTPASTSPAPSAPVLLPAFIRSSHFRPPTDPTRPIVMVGPGTGLAPFRAFLQHRALLQKGGQQLGEALLFFGCRHRHQDYIYREELAAYEESGVLSALHVAFSRDGPSKVYVQHLLKQQAERVWQVVGRRGGSVYVCGDAKAMARDVHHALLEVAVEQGKMAKEAAVALLDGLAEQAPARSASNSPFPPAVLRTSALPAMAPPRVSLLTTRRLSFAGLALCALLAAALFRPALSRASLHVARGRALEEDDEREESSDDGGSRDRMRSQGKTTTTTRAVAARCAASAAPGRAAATSAESPTAAASPPPAAATAAATSELAALHSSTPTAPSCCSRLKPARLPCMCALLMLGQSSATCRVLHALLSLLL
ncbi:unnamed protein product [Closterium sp. NIES-64]|nr:unnamed protein product [Closterium sp. NIES-64]